VVFVFLAVELPLACIMMIFIVQNTFSPNTDLIDPSLLTNIITFSNLCICLSYSIYFPIYCSMSRQFRETFKDLFVRAKQFTHDTARNGMRGGSHRRLKRSQNGGRSPTENGDTAYISTGDLEDETCNRTVITGQVTTSADSDDDKTREGETLL
jgi:hypothetical protein